MKKYLLLFLLLSCVSTAHAVLKDENLDKTIQMFRNELEVFLSEQKDEYNEFKQRRMLFWKDLNKIKEQSNEYALVLYSQQDDYLFGMSHACRQLSETYSDFDRARTPFQTWTADLDHEIQRYRKLEGILYQVNDKDLSAKGKADRKQTFKMCKTIEGYLKERRRMLDEDIAHYNKMARQMSDIRQYTESRGDMIRKKIFVYGSESYFTTLANFPQRCKEFFASVYEIYFTGQNASDAWVARSIELLLVFIAAFIIAFGISFMILKYIIPRFWNNKSLKKKRIHYTFAFSTLLFVGIIFIASTTWLTRNFFIIAANLTNEFFILVGIIALSVTIRVKSNKIKYTYLLYAPTIALASLFLIFRVTLASNEMVAFALPPLLAIDAAIHLALLLKFGSSTERTDNFFSWTSFSLTCILMILSWAGYRFMSLQIFMFWLALMTGFQGIICIRHMLGVETKEHDGKPTLKEIWFDSMINKLVIPILILLVVTGGVIWAAHLFDMVNWITTQMESYFINKPEVAKISVKNIIWLLGLGFVFNYIICLTKEILRSIYEKEYETGTIPVVITLGTIFVWLIYGVTVILTCGINSNGIIAILAGASTGAAFAMKDTFDNFFCGMSLMLGRVRRGDIVECDGYRGKILNMGMHSTNLETVDGSIVSFLNNQLFNKNFKNLTRNHGYELIKIAVGIAYGSDVELARKTILESIISTKRADESRGINIYLNGFGDSSVDLLVFVWVPVSDHYSAPSAIREAIYKGLDEVNITIPFPQQDVYLHPLDAISTIPQVPEELKNMKE